MAQENAHRLYGDTERSSCVPDPQPDKNDGVSNEPLATPHLKGEPLMDASSLKNPLMVGRLADVLVLWDCYADEPWARSPLLLRFERTDLFVIAKSGNGRLDEYPDENADKLAIFCEPVDTSADPCALLQAYQVGNTDTDSRATLPTDAAAFDSDEDPCLTWCLARPLADLIGLQFRRLANLGNRIAIELEDHQLQISSDRGIIRTAISPARTPGF